MPTFDIRVGGKNKQLNARPDRLDLRDRPYNPPLTPLRPQFPTDAEIGLFFPFYEDLILDQGREGACTGYGLAAVINYQYWFRDVVVPAVTGSDGAPTPEAVARLAPRGKQARDRLVSPRMLYQMARLYDEWDGEDYSGSSCRGAIRGWHHHGVCLNRTWPYKQPGPLFEDAPDAATRNAWLREAAEHPLGAYYRIATGSIPDMQAAIQQVHAIYASAWVHDGWLNEAPPDAPASGDLTPLLIDWSFANRTLGVHAFAIVGYNRHGFIVQNSWGKGWGTRGFGLLSYSDWLNNGVDAWASVYGAESDIHFAPKAKSATSLQSARDRAVVDHGPRGYGGAAVSMGWNQTQTALHTIVLGNDGRAMSRLVHAENGAEHLLITAEKRVLRWCAENPANRDLLIYANGGLTGEAEAAHRSAILGPLFKANGIYPLFLSWTSGVIDDLGMQFRDAISAKKQTARDARLGLGDFDRQIAETNDYTWEAIAARVSVRAIWTERKESAARAASGVGGCLLLARHLAALRIRYPELRIHLIGHSAGAITLGSLMDELRALNIRLQSASLWAPACTMDFAVQKFGAAFRDGTIAPKAFHISMLSDENERRDSVAGVYSKSFLHLVSRALERAHKTPLLGLANAWSDPRESARPDEFRPDAKTAIGGWKKAFDKGARPVVIRSREVRTATYEAASGERLIKATHGSFEGSVGALETALERMLGGPPPVPVTDLFGD